jgi:hypothetical protein
MELIRELLALLGPGETFLDVVGFLLALLAFNVTLRHFMRTVRAGHYSQLDQMYADILKMAMENPCLRDKEKIKGYVSYLSSKDTKRTELLGNAARPVELPTWARPPLDVDEEKAARRYDAYAFIVMNFIETIHDRCDENRGWFFHPDPQLVATWKGIIAAEYAMHCEWFAWQTEPYHIDRNPKFCLGFCEFMWGQRWNKKLWGYKWERRIRKDTKYKNKFLPLTTRGRWMVWRDKVLSTVTGRTRPAVETAAPAIVPETNGTKDEAVLIQKSGPAL